MDAGNHWVLTGEDGYEGLTAYLSYGPGGVWGIIVDGESAEPAG